MADTMDVDEPQVKVKKEGKDSNKPKFEVKKVRVHALPRVSPLKVDLCSGMRCRFGPGVSIAWLLIRPGLIW